MTPARALRTPVFALLLLAGCAGEEPLAPPQIRLGRDECAECGMLIMEDRSSAARIIDAGQGPEPQLFDDIGCLLDREREEQGVRVLARYFRDHQTAAWIPEARETFVMAEGVRTPMASGIIAFADPARADSKAAETGGAVLAYDALAEARARSVRERAGGAER